MFATHSPCHSRSSEYFAANKKCGRSNDRNFCYVASPTKAPLSCTCLRLNNGCRRMLCFRIPSLRSSSCVRSSSAHGLLQFGNFLSLNSHLTRSLPVPRDELHAARRGSSPNITYWNCYQASSTPAQITAPLSLAPRSRIHNFPRTTVCHAC